jgi:cytidyltransferase-like protein
MLSKNLKLDMLKVYKNIRTIRNIMASSSETSRKVAIISGYWNPGPHRGHVEYARLAKEFVGEKGLVYVIVNNDEQAMLKKGYTFIPEEDRMAAMGALRYVDKAFLSIDKDRTVCQTIQWICDNVTPKPTHVLNGGDVTADSPCPEEVVCKKNDITSVYGFGDKIQSSSWILEKSVKAAYEKMFGDNSV